MAKVHVSNVVVLGNPASFLDPFQFEVTFECIDELKEDLEWKIIYVGSAESESYDQILDSVFVGPVPEGRHMFVFTADPPDVSKIPIADAVGVTVVLLTCSYRNKEFVRVGYYVNNEYSDSEMRENPPQNPEFDKLTRNILATQPRVTRFKIEWDDDSSSSGKEGLINSEQIENNQGSSEETNIKKEDSELSSENVIPIDEVADMDEEDGIGTESTILVETMSNLSPPSKCADDLSPHSSSETEVILMEN